MEREVMLVRVSADPAQRSELLDAAGVFKAKAVDVGAASVTFEITGGPDKVNDFLAHPRTTDCAALADSPTSSPPASDATARWCRA